MSVYGLSLLTGRQFLIDLNNPCNFSHLFLPNQVNWLMSSSKVDISHNRIYVDCLNNFDPVCLEEYDYLSESSKEKIKKNSVFTIKTNQNWLTFYSENPKFKDKILALGFNATSEFRLHLLFNKWYKKLFKLAPSLEEKYELIKKNALIAPQTKIFCAQIRIGGARPNVKYDLEINEIGVQKYFWRFIRSNFLSKLKSNDDWRIFVTSDVEAVELEALEEFGARRVIRISGVSSHVDRESNLSNDCSRIEKPILDFHFLQNCDKALISRSGFGRLGLWNREEPTKEMFVFFENTIKNNENKIVLNFNTMGPILEATCFVIILLGISMFYFKFKHMIVKTLKLFIKVISRCFYHLFYLSEKKRSQT